MVRILRYVRLVVRDLRITSAGIAQLGERQTEDLKIILRTLLVLRCNDHFLLAKARHRRTTDPVNHHRFRNLRRAGTPDQSPIHALEKRQPSDQIPRRKTHHRRLGKPQRLPDNVHQGRPIARPFKRGLPEKQLVKKNPKGPPIHRAPVPFVFYDLGSQILVGPNKRHRADPGGLRHELWHRQRSDLVPDLWFRFRFLVFLGPAREESWGEARCGDHARRLDARGWLDACRLNAISRGRADRATEGKIEVREHYVTVFSNENVFGLQIAIDDSKH
ncbi:hypothetical protein OSB04_un000037, partial [Centaurea solstitialis]